MTHEKDSQVTSHGVKSEWSARLREWDGMERVTNHLNLEFFIKMATLHENPRFHVKSKVKGKGHSV